MESPTGPPTPPPDAAASEVPNGRWRRIRRWLIGLAVLTATGLGLVYSGAGSWMTARLVAWYVGEIRFQLEPGPSPAPAVAAGGPFDIRLGYRGLPAMVQRLEAEGFELVAQARVSDRFNQVAGLGLFPPYPEKTQAGLRLVGRGGTLISVALFPRAVYADFDSVPGPVRQTLLFLENRELLDDRYPYRNPAIEWDRLVAAVANFAGGKLLGAAGRFGASTLATQLEKLRHSPDGITRTAADKARQMASATLRSYAGGPRTSEVRRTILTDYLNALPVGAVPGYGEVIGLRDGFQAWFGLDPDSADAMLRAAERGTVTAEAARAYRAVVMLLIAQRRPSYYLQTPTGQEAMASMTDAHLRLLEHEGSIPAALIRAAREVALSPRAEAPPTQRLSFVERKAVNAVRAQLLALTGAPGLYPLDRYDLTARVTFDGPAQQAATAMLQRLRDPEFVRDAGLDTERQLGGADLAQVAYSFVLYERTPEGSLVRVQVDNLDRPFDLNSGARLELGSTAKLRTLVTYLEIIAELHAALTDSTTAPDAAARTAGDPLTRWVRDRLAAMPDLDLTALLAEAMQRRYSAHPGETFFTGGGTHTFGNFDNLRDHEVLSVLEGFRHSVNLVSIRLMRDIVRYYEHRLPGYDPGVLTDPAHPARRQILERFADREGRELIARYFRRHRQLAPDSSLALLLGARGTPTRFARLQLALTPAMTETGLDSLLQARFPAEALAGVSAARVRSGMPAQLSLADRAFVTGVHPLELWVVGALRQAPDTALADLQTAGEPARREAYAWLFRNTPSVRRAQDRSIRVTLEREAFEPILAGWRRVGYPYADMVPSLSSSIGSSGDRPGALAELVGILQSDGVRAGTVRIAELHFGEGTPYEVVLRRRPEPGTRVLPIEVAVAARAALADVVERGTATQLRGQLVVDSTPVEIGGKTGTGQNEARTFGAGGRLLASRTLSRTATFVFYLGDRFYGVATAFVEGPAAERFRFTSGLPVRVVRLMLPEIRSLLESPAPAGPARVPDAGAGPPGPGDSLPASRPDSMPVAPPDSQASDRDTVPEAIPDTAGAGSPDTIPVRPDTLRTQRRPPGAGSASRAPVS